MRRLSPVACRLQRARRRTGCGICGPCCVACGVRAWRLYRDGPVFQELAPCRKPLSPLSHLSPPSPPSAPMLGGLATVLTLAACAGTGQPPAAPGAPAAAAAAPGGLCNAQPAQVVLGQSSTASVVESARVRSGARMARILRPGQTITKEFNAQRLSLQVDGNGRIIAARCG